MEVSHELKLEIFRRGTGRQAPLARSPEPRHGSFFGTLVGKDAVGVQSFLTHLDGKSEVFYEGTMSVKGESFMADIMSFGGPTEDLLYQHKLVQLSCNAIGGVPVMKCDGRDDIPLDPATTHLNIRGDHLLIAVPNNNKNLLLLVTHRENEREIFDCDALND